MSPKFQAGDRVILPRILGEGIGTVEVVTFDDYVHVNVGNLSKKIIAIVPAEHLHLDLPPEPQEIGHVYDSPRTGHKYARSALAYLANRCWIRLTEPHLGDQSRAYATWEEIS